MCAGVLPREDVVVVDLKRMSAWRKLDRGALRHGREGITGERSRSEPPSGDERKHAGRSPPQESAL